MNENIIISIIIPVYNVEKYLGNCVKSILNQPVECLRHCEIILVDDGSTDESPKLCDWYAGVRPELVSVYHKKNGGLLSARRLGFEKANGKYILNCDSDDFLAENCLTELLTTISANDSDVIIFNMDTVDQNGHKKAFAENIFPNTVVGKEAVIKEFFSTTSIVSMCCKCVKREFVSPEKTFEQYYWVKNGEDTLQSIEVYSKANTFVYINRSLYFYRASIGMSSKIDPRYYDSFKACIEEAENAFSSRNNKNVEILLAIKLFASTGRAITQLQTEKIPFGKTIGYLKKIREDEYYLKYSKYYYQVKNKLTHNYLLLNNLLQKKWYVLIIILLKFSRICHGIRPKE